MSPPLRPADSAASAPSASELTLAARPPLPQFDDFNFEGHNLVKRGGDYDDDGDRIKVSSSPFAD